MKILIQAGHEGRTSGSTGAPNEQSFNIDISNQVADKLRNMGVEVRRINADPKATEISGDWDLFLAIHYDADVYGKGGYFVDYPEPSTDGATLQSQAICKTLSEVYGETTKIVNYPMRSNKNTRFYYMWSKISPKTPCVLIECGVGMHIPDDHEILHFNRPLVVKGIVDGLIKALDIKDPVASIQPDPHLAEILKLNEKITALENSMNDLRLRIVEMEKMVESKDEIISRVQSELESANIEKQKALADVDYYKPYKALYENKLKETVDKYTGKQLLAMAIKKILSKK